MTPPAPISVARPVDEPTPTPNDQTSRLLASARHFESLVASSDDAIVSKNLDGVVLSWNPAAERLFGYTAAEMVGQPILRLFPPDRLDEEDRLLAAVRSGRRVHHFETLRLKKGGVPVHVSITLSPIYGLHGEVTGASKIARSIEARVQTDMQLAELHRQAKHFEALVSSSDDAIVSKGLDGIIRTWNPAAERLFGYSAAEMVGESVRKLFPPDRLGEETEFMNTIRAGGRIEHFETVRVCKNGNPLPVSVTLSPITDGRGDIVGVSKIARDISDRLRSEKEIWTHANFDALTGLPNRRMLRLRGEQAIAEATRRQEQLALVYIDVDFFKSVNDEHGHGVGDELLVEVARRLKQAVREEDMVARLGGDEFVVLLGMDKGLGLVDTIVGRMQQQMDAPFVIDGQRLKVSLSAGISLFPVDSASWTELLGHADKALYDAKGAGRHRVHYFTAALENKAQQRRQMLHELQRALEQDQLLLHYQPVVRMSDGVMVKAEALIRWPHPQRGWIGPAEFIPLAEQSGLIHEISDLVVRCVHQQAQRAAALWGPQFVLAFNLSPSQLKHQPHLLGRWRRAVGVDSWRPAQLMAEITEGMLVDQDPVTQDNLRELTQAGMAIAIDDFGTGYSSLSYLSQINAHILKIDQSFTRQLPHDAKAMVLCEAMVVMAHKLGMTVVAEGVETAEVWHALRRMGCDLAQGFLIARALPPADFEAFSFDISALPAP